MPKRVEIAFCGSEKDLATAVRCLNNIHSEFATNIVGSKGYSEAKPCFHWFFDPERTQIKGTFSKMLDKILALPNISLQEDCPVCHQKPKK